LRGARGKPRGNPRTQGAQAGGEGALDRIEVGEEVVGEAPLAQRLPQVLGRIQLGAVGRQEQQSHVGRHLQLAGQMPAGLVHDHQHELPGVALRDLLQEQRHRLRADPRQHKAVQHAVIRTDGAESVEVPALQASGDHWAHAARRPAATRRAQQAEALLVLEHQPQPAAGFEWAPFRTTKAAIKLHTLLDLRGAIPAFIHISDGKLHDVNVLDLLAFEAGAFYVMDRGYVDFARLHALH
jgi:hypothetical protein